MGNLGDTIQICVITAHELTEDRLLGFEMMIEASRQNPCCIGDFMQRGVRTGACDHRRCCVKNLGASLPNILANA